MRAFTLFAVLWTALFGSGHVLAACPMGQAPASAMHSGHQHDSPEPAAHAPCHTEGTPSTGHDTSSPRGHDCCAWLAPSPSTANGVVQKSSLLLLDDRASAGTHFLNAMLWDGPQASRPPPIPIPQLVPCAADRGTDTFLRTGRLRL